MFHFIGEKVKFLGGASVKLLSKKPPSPLFSQWKYYPPVLFWLVSLALILVKKMIFHSDGKSLLTPNTALELRK